MNPDDYWIVCVTAIVVFFAIVWFSQRHDPKPKPIKGCVYHAVVEKIDHFHDADTFYAYIKGIKTITGKPWGVRIRHINVAENEGKTKAAKLAEEIVEKHLKNCEVIHLYNLDADMYGNRALADVFCNGVNIGKELLDRKLAKPYEGHGKKEFY